MADKSNKAYPELSQGAWGNYYGTAVTFSQNNKDYLFAQTSHKDRWFIAELTPDGVGPELAHGNWGSFYKTAVVFASGGKNYLFGQTSHKDRWFIAELTPSGVGLESAHGNWGNFYETAVVFTSGVENYLFGQTRNKDRWFIAELTPDGIGSELAHGNWGNFYGTVVAFNMGGKHYLFGQAAQELERDETLIGNVPRPVVSERWFVSELTPDRTGVSKELANGNWGHYYGTALSFVQNGIPYMFAQTATSNDRWFISYAFPYSLIEWKNNVIDTVYADPDYNDLDTYSDILFTEEFENPTGATLTEHFTHTLTKSCTFEWSLTETLLTGMEAEFEAEIPFIGSASTTVKVELTLESSQTTSETQEEEYSIDVGISVPANVSLKATWTIDWDDYVSIPFTLLIIVSGSVAGVALSTDQVIEALKAGGFEGRVEQKSVPNEVTVCVKGSFSGAYGMETHFIAEPIELAPSTPDP